VRRRRKVHTPARVDHHRLKVNQLRVDNKNELQCRSLGSKRTNNNKTNNLPQSSSRSTMQRLSWRLSRKPWNIHW